MNLLDSLNYISPKLTIGLLDQLNYKSLFFQKCQKCSIFFVLHLELFLSKNIFLIFLVP